MTTAVFDEAFQWYSEQWDPDMPLGEWWDRLATAGWSFPKWPEGSGGRGMSTNDAREAERARVAVGAHGPPKGIATFLVAPTLMAYGTPEQLDRFMPGIVRGTEVWCQLFPSRVPVPTLLALRREQCLTATNGSSTARRSGTPVRSTRSSGF